MVSHISFILSCSLSTDSLYIYIILIPKTDYKICHDVAPVCLSSLDPTCSSHFSTNSNELCVLPFYSYYRLLPISTSSDSCLNCLLSRLTRPTNAFIEYIIALQCCVDFCYIMKWMNYIYTCVPSLLGLPPPSPIPSMSPQSGSLSSLLMFLMLQLGVTSLKDSSPIFLSLKIHKHLCTNIYTLVLVCSSLSSPSEWGCIKRKPSLDLENNYSCSCVLIVHLLHLKRF